MKQIELTALPGLLKEGYLVVDTRPADVFADGFISGAVSVQYTENFLANLDEIINEQKAVLVVSPANIREVIKTVAGSGITNIIGYTEEGFEGPREAGINIDLLILIDADEFAMDYKHDEFYLVDVREEDLFEKEHVEDAENLPLANLEPALGDLEADASYYIYGDTTNQAVTAASLFKRQGFERVRTVNAGLEDLKNAGVPVFLKKKKPGTGPKMQDN